MQLSDVGCTAVLIHTRGIITAAHCVDQLAPDSGTKNFWRDNFSIQNFGGGSFDGTVRINIHPDFTGSHGGGLDDGDDIALIKLTEGTFGFPDEDRHRVYVGAMSTIGTMKLYGRGVTSHDGGGSGVLRRMQYTPTWSGPEHFLNEAGTSRVCKGDSGGPSLDNVPSSGVSVVAGLNTSVDANGDDMCATTGGKQRQVRLQHKIRWIDQMLGGTDSDDCTEFNADGWVYERCW
jgi:hypothetical protein